MTSPAPLVVELADAGERAGGKAAGLGLLIAAGLPVPAGFALTGAAFAQVTGGASDDRAVPALAEIGARLDAWTAAAETRAIPPALEAEVRARADALGGPLAVRSSMAIEDRAGAAAPGLGLSVLGVAPADVWSAIRAVWAASLTPLVIAYARGAAAQPAGVIVQREVAGARVVVYTRPPGRPHADELWIDGDERELLRLGRDPVAAPAELAGAARLALAAEAAIAANGGADVELIDGAAGWAVVQARPIVHPPVRPPRPPAPPILLAALRDPPRAWVRDVSHNPDPLSPAQTGLCERVERAARAPFHLAVVAGFLYAAPRDGAVMPAPPPDEAELAARYASHAAAVERALAGAGDGADLDAALAAYLAAYHVLAIEIGPLVAAGRRPLIEALRASGASAREAVARAAALVPRRRSSVAAALADAAAGRIDRATLLDRIGDVALAWDVAAPTFAERPALVDDAIVRARARPAPPPEPEAPPALTGAVALARAAADLAERDDLLFARAQAVVRRALLAYAARAGIAADDICWLPLDEVVADAHAPVPAIDPVRAATRAAGARAAAERAAGWELPLTIAGAEAPSLPAAAAWHGDGIGGRVVGPAAVITQLADAGRVPRHAIVVARAITPALALIVEGAAALICEHGSLLDHGAAMARELGIPCVVGCAGIVDAIVDGDWLEVDGDAGRVLRRH